MLLHFGNLSKNLMFYFLLWQPQVAVGSLTHHTLCRHPPTLNDSQQHDSNRSKDGGGGKWPQGQCAAEEVLQSHPCVSSNNAKPNGNGLD